MPGPIAAAVAPTAAAPRSAIPCSKPRRPPCTIIAPPGPAAVIGRQSAPKTRPTTPGSAITWPSASAGTAPPLWKARSVPCTCQALTTASGSTPSAARGAKLSRAEPKERVVKAAVAPGNRVSSQRRPSRSRHSIAAPRHVDRHVQLLGAATDLAVELAPQGLIEPAADRRALGNARSDQRLAVDLEGDVAPLGQVAVEPLGA